MTDPTAIASTREHVNEVFAPAVRWLRSSPAERNQDDHLAAFNALVDLAWPGGWKASCVREGETWILTASRDLSGEPLTATAREDDFLTCLVALYDALLRRLDKIEAKVTQLALEVAA